MFIRTLLATALLVSTAALPAVADVTEAELKSISTPDKVETPIGTIEFFDGVPVGDTLQKVYDNLDLSRGLAVFLDNQGAASLHAMRAGSASIGADASNKFTITEQFAAA